MMTLASSGEGGLLAVTLTDRVDDEAGRFFIIASVSISMLKCSQIQLSQPDRRHPHQGVLATY